MSIAGRITASAGYTPRQRACRQQVRSWLAHRELQHHVAAAVRLQAHVRARLSRHLLSPHLLVRSIAHLRRLAATHTARALEQVDTSNLQGATQAAVNEAAARFLELFCQREKCPLSGQMPQIDRGSNPPGGTVFLGTYFSRVAARWPTLAGLVPICPRGHFSRFDPKVPHFSNKDPRVSSC